MTSGTRISRRSTPVMEAAAQAAEALQAQAQDRAGEAPEDRAGAVSEALQAAATQGAPALRRARPDTITGPAMHTSLK